MKLTKTQETVLAAIRESPGIKFGSFNRRRSAAARELALVNLVEWRDGEKPGWGGWFPLDAGAMKEKL